MIARNGDSGVLVAPGPDLVWLTGYRPTAVTERLTVLVLQPEQEPTLVVPILERHDAEQAAGAQGMAVLDGTDASDPYLLGASLLDPQGSYGISDSAWARHLLGLQAQLPQTAYHSLTQGGAARRGRSRRRRAGQGPGA